MHNAAHGLEPLRNVPRHRTPKVPLIALEIFLPLGNKVVRVLLVSPPPLALFSQLMPLACLAGDSLAEFGLGDLAVLDLLLLAGNGLTDLNALGFHLADAGLKFTNGRLLCHHGLAEAVKLLPQELVTLCHGRETSSARLLGQELVHLQLGLAVLGLEGVLGLLGLSVPWQELFLQQLSGLSDPHIQSLCFSLQRGLGLFVVRHLLLHLFDVDLELRSNLDDLATLTLNRCPVPGQLGQLILRSLQLVAPSRGLILDLSRTLVELMDLHGVLGTLGFELVDLFPSLAELLVVDGVLQRTLVAVQLLVLFQLFLLAFKLFEPFFNVGDHFLDLVPLRVRLVHDFQ
mmetsp:Transcript_24707/g.72477  ORF Transcript_24707/g.72477 Transcript_24707/m.72477 type:complete len:344 (+) Transcript_24707:2357-3388(+)